MNVGLVLKKCENKNIVFNENQIKTSINESKSKNVDYIFFGESYLQGFDSLCWDYNLDKEVAISKDDQIIKRISQVSKENSVGVGFGYFENNNGDLYSSYIIFDQNGEEILNYRRVSKGWKHFRHTNDRYKEGSVIADFMLGDVKCNIALCGDLWDQDTTEMFLNESVKNTTLLWPLHVDFTLEEWKYQVKEYHKQALKYSSKTLMVNNIMQTSTHGGAFIFERSSLLQLPFDKEDMLIINI